MSFLQSWILWGLPAVLLPIVIHLIHKRRHRVVEWGAMRFLMQGAQMSRGMQRLRHFVLLALRTLAVLGLIMGLGRPLAGGWLGGVGGGRPDTVLVLLDRSASMSAQTVDGGATKLAAGVARVADALESVEAARLLCIDSVTLAPVELDAASDLLSLPIATETAGEADIPAMLEVAAQYLEENSTGRAEIWILSDAQTAGWAAEDGRWPLLDESLAALPAGVRVNVLNLKAARKNLAVRVEHAERVVAGDTAELVLDILVRASGTAAENVSVPVALDVNGARSIVSVDVTGTQGEVRGHRVQVALGDDEGWGFVELPGDANAIDNRYYFTFGAGETAETVVVYEDEAVRDVLRFAAEAPVREGTRFVVDSYLRSETSDLQLANATQVLWQGALPVGDNALAVERFVEAGGRVLFLPSREGDTGAFLGCSFGPEVELGDGSAPVAPSFWRKQDDLLRDGDDGTPLTVGELLVARLWPPVGDVTRLAGFASGETLLARIPTAHGGAYMLATLPSAGASNLASQGVTLVALVARGLEAALDELGSRGQVDAGAFAPLGEAGLVSEISPDWLLSEHFQHAGVARVGTELVGLNRSAAEDEATALNEDRLAGLLPHVDVSWVVADAEEGGLVEEVWRAFLMLLLVALLGEAVITVTESSPRPVGRA